MLQFSSTREELLSKKKSGSTTLTEKRRVVMQVLEQEGSPIDSPQTTSGLWSDTGMSTGDISNKPQFLDLQDVSIGTDVDVSEMSPMNIEEESGKELDQDLSQVASEGTESPKPVTEIETMPRETSDTATSPVKPLQSAAAVSPIKWDQPIFEDRGTDPVVKPIPTCDVKLSPILFTESKGTSPMSAQGESPSMVDASSSPPKRCVQSAATSPPKIFEYQSISLKRDFKEFQFGQDEGQAGPFEFEMDLDSPMMSISKKYVDEMSSELKSHTYSESMSSFEASRHEETRQSVVLDTAAAAQDHPSAVQQIEEAKMSDVNDEPESKLVERVQNAPEEEELTWAEHRTVEAVVEETKLDIKTVEEKFEATEMNEQEVEIGAAKEEKIEQEVKIESDEKIEQQQVKEIIETISEDVIKQELELAREEDFDKAKVEIEEMKDQAQSRTEDELEDAVQTETGMTPAEMDEADTLQSISDVIFEQFQVLELEDAIKKDSIEQESEQMIRMEASEDVKDEVVERSEVEAKDASVEEAAKKAFEPAPEHVKDESEEVEAKVVIATQVEHARETETTTLVEVQEEIFVKKAVTVESAQKTFEELEEKPVKGDSAVSQTEVEKNEIADKIEEPKIEFRTSEAPETDRKIRAEAFAKSVSFSHEVHYLEAQISETESVQGREREDSLAEVEEVPPALDFPIKSESKKETIMKTSSFEKEDALEQNIEDSHQTVEEHFEQVSTVELEEEKDDEKSSELIEKQDYEKEVSEEKDDEELIRKDSGLKESFDLAAEKLTELEKEPAPLEIITITQHHQSQVKITFDEPKVILAEEHIPITEPMVKEPETEGAEKSDEPEFWEKETEKDHFEEDDVYHVRVSEISSYQSTRLFREESSDSAKQVDSKSEEIDELLLLVMPPGHARLNMEDQDESEFDHINAPRIIVTPTFDDYSDNQESIQEDLAVEPAKPLEILEESHLEEEEEEIPEQLVTPAIKCSILHSLKFGEQVEKEQIEGEMSEDIHSEATSSTLLQDADLEESVHEKHEREEKEKVEAKIEPASDLPEAETTVVVLDEMDESVQDIVQGDDDAKTQTESGESTEVTKAVEVVEPEPEELLAIVEEQHEPKLEETTIATEHLQDVEKVEPESVKVVVELVSVAENGKASHEEAALELSEEDTLNGFEKQAEEELAAQHETDIFEKEQFMKEEKVMVIVEQAEVEQLEEKIEVESEKESSIEVVLSRESELQETSETEVKVAEIEHVSVQEEVHQTVIVKVSQQVAEVKATTSAIEAPESSTAQLKETCEQEIKEVTAEASKESTERAPEVKDIEPIGSSTEESDLDGDGDDDLPHLCMLARSLRQSVTEREKAESVEKSEIVSEEHYIEVKPEFELYKEQPKMTSIMTRTLSSENIQSFDDESGFEMTAGRDMKSFDDSTLMEQSFETYPERTDSLLQESTLHESLSLEKTITESTLEADLASDGMEDLEIESFTPGAGLMATELKQEDIASPLSEDHKTEEKDSSHEITLSPETEKFEEKVVPQWEGNLEESNRNIEAEKVAAASAAAALTQVLGEKIEEEEVINEKTFETELEEPVPAEQTHSEAKQKEDKSDEKQIEKVKDDLTTSEQALEQPAGEIEEKQAVEVKAAIEVGEGEEVEEEIEIRSKTRSFTKQLESQIQIPTQPVSETVELLPIIAWNVTSQPPADYPKLTLAKEQSGEEQDHFDLPGHMEHEVHHSDTTPSTDHCYSPGQESAVYSSSRCSERSGTQSSIELHSSSRSDKYEYSSSPAASHSSKMSYETEHSSSASKEISASEVSTSSKATTSSEASHLSLPSHTSESKSSGSDEASGTEPSAVSEDPEKSKTSTSGAESEQCHSKESSNDELSLSTHSLPSSPRRLRRAHSSGVKKLTSEIFSTESDITRSLEIVYKEPAENSRRKLSEKYRHVSSNGASDGSISNDSQKIEKRKASVTQLRGRTDSRDQDLGAASAASGAKSPSPRSSDDEAEKAYGGGVAEQPQPPLEKKQPSPTKLKQPVAVVEPELTSAEVISPVLKVVCQTPERSQKHLYKYVEGTSLSLQPHSLSR